MSNYERIKNMTIEEMADFLGGLNDRACVGCDQCYMRTHCEFPELTCTENAMNWLIEEKE